MNREEKKIVLQSVAAISFNLQDDIGLVEHKVLQTNNDINRLEDIIDDLKQKKDAVMADDYLGFNTVEAMGECMLHLSVVVAKLEQKVAALKMALEAVNEAVAEVNYFANMVPEIPTNE